MIKITKLAFEQRYSDDSGVEFAVRYSKENEAEIEVESGYAIRFPIEELDWLIDCLQKIREETR